MSSSQLHKYKNLVENQKEELIEILATLGLSENFSLKIPIPEEDTPLSELYVAILVVAEHLNLTLSQKYRSEKLTKSLEEKVNIIRAQNKKLEELDKLKSDFLSTVSHELRTPMTAVLGFTELLSSLITDQKQMEYLEAIKFGGQNLLYLINDILDLSKADAGKIEIKLQPTDLKQLVNDIPTIFSLKLSEKGLRLIIEIDPNIPSVLLMDESRINQIFFNLVDNAIKFTDEGYIKIIIKQENIISEGSEIDLYIAVEDTGMGIPKDEHEYIFEAFHQRKGQDHSKYGGSGLGLAITKKLVEAMKGDLSIKYRSDKCKGTLFVIHFAGVEVSALEVKKSSEEIEYTSSITFKPAKILIVDDVKSNRDLIYGIFHDTDIEVLSANDGYSGLILAKEQNPNLILMDLKMPVMNGYKATRMIKSNESTKDIPVIALSADVSKSENELTGKYQFDGYLQKPIPRRKLYNELTKYLSFEYINTQAMTYINKNSDIFSFSSSMGELSIELKSRLKTSIEHIDIDKMDSVITEIEQINSILSDEIRLRIEQFNYEYILKYL